MMNFTEYKNANYWERKRKMGEDSFVIEAKDLSIFLLGFIGLIVTLTLGCI